MGVVFLPWHIAEAAANLLTIDVLDSEALIPEFKACAVQVSRRGKRTSRIRKPSYIEAGIKETKSQALCIDVGILLPDRGGITVHRSSTVRFSSGKFE